MKWVRCPKCRTVNDIDRYATCDGCNVELSVQPLRVRAGPAIVQIEAQRDNTRARVVLIVLGVLSAVAIGFLLFAPDSDQIFMAACLAVPLLGVFFRFAAGRKTRTPSERESFPGAEIALGCFAAFGAGILVFIVCAGRVIATIP